MTVDEFRAAVAVGKIKQMGFKESLLMVGAGLGVEFESVTDEKVSIVAREIRAGPRPERECSAFRR